MRSSRNYILPMGAGKTGCSILENAVKPQLHWDQTVHATCCSILENAVKPQLSVRNNARFLSCSILENAVKPQLSRSPKAPYRWCSILKNAMHLISSFFRQSLWLSQSLSENRAFLVIAILIRKPFHTFREPLGNLFQKSALIAPNAFKNGNPVFGSDFFNLVMAKAGFFHSVNKLRQLRAIR